MKRLIKRKRNRIRKFCGHSADGIYEILNILCDLEDGIDMTEYEEEALDVAIQAVASIRNAMVTDGKIRWEE